MSMCMHVPVPFIPCTPEQEVLDIGDHGITFQGFQCVENSVAMCTRFAIRSVAFASAFLVKMLR